MHLILCVTSQHTRRHGTRDFRCMLLAFSIDGRMNSLEIWCRFRMKQTLFTFLLLDRVHHCLLFDVVNFRKANNIKIFVTFLCPCGLWYVFRCTFFIFIRRCQLSFDSNVSILFRFHSSTFVWQFKYIFCVVLNRRFRFNDIVDFARLCDWKPFDEVFIELNIVFVEFLMFGMLLNCEKKTRTIFRLCCELCSNTSLDCQRYRKLLQIQA